MCTPEISVRGTETRRRSRRLGFILVQPAMPLSLVPDTSDHSSRSFDAPRAAAPIQGTPDGHAPTSVPVIAVPPIESPLAARTKLPPGDPVGGTPEDVRAALAELPPWAAVVLDLANTAERDARVRATALQEATSAIATAWRELPREMRALAGSRAPRAPRPFRVAAGFTRGLADGYCWWVLHLPVLRQAHDRLPDDAWTMTLANYVRAANSLATEESCAGRALQAAGREQANHRVEAELHARTKSLVATRARASLQQQR